MDKIAVVTTYSFDNHAFVVLVDDLDEAIEYIRKSCEEEFRIDTQENGWGDITEYFISEYGEYAVLTNHFADRDDITTWRVGSVFTREEVTRD
jgi:hypothetical protein